MTSTRAVGQAQRVPQLDQIRLQRQAAFHDHDGRVVLTCPVLPALVFVVHLALSNMENATGSCKNVLIALLETSSWTSLAGGHGENLELLSGKFRTFLLSSRNTFPVSSQGSQQKSWIGMISFKRTCSTARRANPHLLESVMTHAVRHLQAAFQSSKRYRRLQALWTS
jgi:hypothetical protein